MDINIEINRKTDRYIEIEIESQSGRERGREPAVQHIVLVALEQPS
jgi:hypothetical protein